MEFAEHERQAPRLNIAPLIDVVFLLLVFFMLAGSMVDPAEIELAMSMPSSSAPSPAPSTVIVIDVKLDGEVRLNGLTLTLEALGPALAGQAGAAVDTPVAVRAEARVPVQRLVAVMDRIQSVGMSNIRLATPQGQ